MASGARKGNEELSVKTIELSEYHNFGIQQRESDMIIEEEEEKIGISSSYSQSHKDRIPGRISCTHRALARHYRLLNGISVGSSGPSD